jgi:hypothetical protein
MQGSCYGATSVVASNYIMRINETASGGSIRACLHQELALDVPCASLDFFTGVFGRSL